LPLRGLGLFFGALSELHQLCIKIGFDLLLALLCEGLEFRMADCLFLGRYLGGPLEYIDGVELFQDRGLT
jgi:hypothetical protein